MKPKTNLSLLALAVLLALTVSVSPSLTVYACHSYYPTGLVAIARQGGGVVLEWAPPQNYGALVLGGYYVYRADSGGGKQKLNEQPIEACRFVDETVQPGVTYTYWVTAYFPQESETGFSEKAVITVPGGGGGGGGGSEGAPIPTGLVAAVLEGGVRLEWRKPAAREGYLLIGYNVYRFGGDGGGEAVRLNDGLVAECGFTDRTSKLGRAYFYFVTARYEGGIESKPSEKVPVDLAGGGKDAPAPRGLTGIAEGTTVKLTWLAPETVKGLDLVGYYVYRGDSKYGYDEAPLNDFTTPECLWTDNTVQPGLTYRYFVTAVYANGAESKGSNEVEVSLDGKLIVLTVGSGVATVGGTEVELDQPPTIVDGRTMLPFRFVAENLGAEVFWNADSQEVTAAAAGVTVVLTVGSQTALVNGEPRPINVPPSIVNGRTMVPLRFLADAFGWNLVWDNVKRQVVITASGD